MTTFDLEEREAIADFGRAWWLFLVTGILWLLVAIIVLRFDYTTVAAISILFGVVAIFAGVNEFFMLAASSGWWKVLHGLLGVIFVGVGIIAFIHPGDTFAALAAVMSFFLIFKGFFDIVVSIAGAAWEGRFGDVWDELLRKSFELIFFAQETVA